MLFYIIITPTTCISLVLKYSRSFFVATNNPMIRVIMIAKTMKIEYCQYYINHVIMIKIYIVFCVIRLYFFWRRQIQNNINNDYDDNSKENNSNHIMCLIVLLLMILPTDTSSYFYHRLVNIPRILYDGHLHKITKILKHIKSKHIIINYHLLFEWW